MYHIVCYSGGHSSAIVAVEVARRYGLQRTILLNHDIHPSVESADIKRFKGEVAAYIGLPVTYANMLGWDQKDQFDVVVEAGAFKVGSGTALCTNRLKTRPFEEYLRTTFPRKNAVVYYGFDAGETSRILRRHTHLSMMGYRTDFPLAKWATRTIQNTREVGILPPSVYSEFKHANCTGCLKAGRQHWYVVYCTRRDVWERAVWAEDMIGYTIIKGTSLLDLEPLFRRMREYGVVPTEHVAPAKFWSVVRRAGLVDEVSPESDIPCECVV